MMKMFKRLLLTIFLVFFLFLRGFSHRISFLDSAQNSKFSQLHHEIELVVNNYKGLSAGIALIGKDQPDWIVEIENREASDNKSISVNTIFRTASISKMFVALAILKLKEEGHLKLEDRIKDIVHDVEFENPWEDTYPVRIVHLLEHTTGWDESHLVEMIHDQTPPITLKGALEFHPHSRKSRWPPGSRVSYCNSDYAVAGLIVEKVSGLPFEKYVYENILRPLQMEYTTYFNDSLYQKWGAETYNSKMESVDYKNELYRPAAALNSSPKDMAQLLKMLLNRGSIDSFKMFRNESVDRMERFESMPGAQAGLELGYGLGNFTSVYQGLTYHGHDGAMEGGISQLAYLPDEGVGHVILLNANNAQAMQQIMTLIRDFEIAMLSHEKPQNLDYQGTIALKEGYYLSINPRSQNRFYQDIFLNIDKIEVHDNHISRSWIVPGSELIYYPVSPTQFTLGNSKKIGLVEANDPIAGKVLYTETSVLKPISTIRVYVQSILLGLWIVLMIFAFLSFPFVILLYLIDRIKNRHAIGIGLITTLTSLLIVLILYFQFFGIENSDMLFSKPTFISISLLIASLLFVIGAFMSGFVIYQSRHLNIKKLIYYPFSLLSFLHMIASIYLVFHGFIPLLTWV